MATTDGATRSRKWRERTERCSRGDHALCGPRTKCPRFAPTEASSPAVSTTAAPAPAGLGARGRGLWSRVDTGRLSPLHLEVLAEACRVVDTLERLHGMAEDGALLDLVRGEAEDPAVLEVRVVVTPLLGEIRSQQQVLRAKAAELRLGAGRAEPARPGGEVPRADTATPAPGSGGLGDLIDAAGRFGA